MSESAAPSSVQAPAVIQFNGSELPLVHAITLADLLSAQAVAPGAVATAVNGQFVARELRGITWLRPGDQVLTFQAIVGG
jgi:sulfur carrier protein